MGSPFLHWALASVRMGLTKSSVSPPISGGPTLTGPAMTRTTSLRQQHDIILQKAMLLQDMAIRLDDPASTKPLLRELDRFDRLLTAHLISEDSFLYPDMAASGDRLAASTATAFMDDMGGLAASYKAFIDEWRDEARIGADPKGFAAAFKRIVFALSHRIHRENSELYPLADAMYEAQLASRPGSGDQLRKRA